MGAITDYMKRAPKARTVLLTAFGGIIGWLGTNTLKNIEEIERVALESKTRIERLEKDDSKWMTLAEQQKQIVALAIEVEVLKRLSRIRGDRAAPPRFEPSEDEGDEEASEPSPPASPPTPITGQNNDVSPREIEKFKNMQEQRYQEKK